MCSSGPKPAHGLPGVGLEEYRQPQLYAKVSRAEPAPCVLIARRLITALPAFCCFLGQAGSRVPKQGKHCRNWSWHLPARGCFGGFYSTASAGSFFSISMKAFTCHQALRTELGRPAAAPWAPHCPGCWVPPSAPSVCGGHLGALLPAQPLPEDVISLRGRSPGAAGHRAGPGAGGMLVPGWSSEQEVGALARTPPGASCSPHEPWDPNRPPPAPLLPSSVSQGVCGEGGEGDKGVHLGLRCPPWGTAPLPGCPRTGGCPPCGGGVPCCGVAVLDGTELGT